MHIVPRGVLISMIGCRDRKTRRWLTLLFVVSLLLNVQSAFACTMMSDMPDMPEPTHECCLSRHAGKISNAPELAGSDTDSCFILKTSLQVKGSADTDADPGNDYGLVKDKQGLEDLTFSMALLVLAILPVSRASGSIAPPHDEIHHFPLPIYQATQRYRI